ncbi:MAG: YihY/virulence factor BrkB family protein [Anaplasmataceae bacterium]|nr:YihY/virulence factor BrkB family protein [Anaplasmataceae bacterium]
MSIILIKNIYNNLYYALNDLIKHDGIEHAGYLSFLTLLAIFPFFFIFTIVSVNITEILTSHYTYSLNEIENIISTIFPSEIYKEILPELDKFLQIKINNSTIFLLSMSSIWTASSSIEGLRTILNKSYRIHNPPTYILRRLLSIVQFLLFILIILITTSTIAFFPLIEIIVKKYNISFINIYINYTIIACTILILIIAIYKILPNKKLKIKEILPGSFLVLISWFVASKVFSYYIKGVFFQLNVIYGSFVSIILFLLFFYIIYMLLIYGAEFNFNYYNKKSKE